MTVPIDWSRVIKIKKKKRSNFEKILDLFFFIGVLRQMLRPRARMPLN